MYTFLERTAHPSDIEQILNMLLTLPVEKVVEVRDYVAYLQSRYSTESQIDHSDAWDDEDLKDFALASGMYMSHSLALMEDADV